MLVSEYPRLRSLVQVYKNGDLVHQGSNLIVTAGLNLLASIIGASGTKPSHLACGSSATGAAAGQTALLGTEHDRVSITTSVVDNSVTYSGTFDGTGFTASPGSDSVREFGLFNDATTGTMLARFTIAQLTVDSSDELDVDWSITLTP